MGDVNTNRNKQNKKNENFMKIQIFTEMQSVIRCSK